MNPDRDSYRQRVAQQSATSQAIRKYQNRHFIGNVARKALGFSNPSLELQRRDIEALRGQAEEGDVPLPRSFKWAPYHDHKFPKGKAGKYNQYTLWYRDLKGTRIYTAKEGKYPPSENDGGYPGIDALIKKFDFHPQTEEEPDEGLSFDDGMFEKERIMKKKNINPMRENDFIDEVLGIDFDSNPVAEQPNDTGIEMNAGGGATVDLGPVTNFDYSMQGGAGEGLAMDNMANSVWESVDPEALIKRCAERGLTKPQIKKVLESYGFIESGTPCTAKISKEKDGYTVALYSKATGDRKDILATGLSKQSAEKKAREYNSK